MHFDWDDKKAAANIKNHDGVRFDEAETVFGDPLASVFIDEDHSFEEKREIIAGYSSEQRLLVVCFTERVGELPPGVRILMNAANTNMSQTDADDEMRSHYDFDYSKAKPNRFAERYNKMVGRVGLAPDVADEFPTEESVNDALREYIRITRTPNVEISGR